MIHLEPCEETLKRFEDNSIDLIITSPPYNIGKMHSNRLKFGSYANNDMKEPDYQKWQIEVLNECYRVLSENGSMFYNHKVRIKDGKAIHPTTNYRKTFNSTRSMREKLRLLRQAEKYWDMKPFNVDENSKEEEVDEALQFISSLYNFFDTYNTEIENILL